MPTSVLHMCGHRYAHFHSYDHAHTHAKNIIIVHHTIHMLEMFGSVYIEFCDPLNNLVPIRRHPYPQQSPSHPVTAN